MRRDFVASASHELKTPVAAILASAEALQMALSRDPASAQRFGEQIERLARQLAKLVGDLLDLSRLEASEPDHESVRLDQVAEEEVNRFRPAAESAGLTLTSSSSAISVSGSRRDLGLAIRNLLENAIRHTPAGGAIELRLRSDNGDALVEVVDSGEGIPKRELPRIFERFYRVDTARARATGGTGLGLAIVRHVVERHGGSVQVESELGQGSTFRLRIPETEDGSRKSDRRIAEERDRQSCRVPDANASRAGYSATSDFRASRLKLPPSVLTPDRSSLVLTSDRSGSLFWL